MPSPSRTEIRSSAPRRTSTAITRPPNSTDAAATSPSSRASFHSSPRRRSIARNVPGPATYSRGPWTATIASPSASSSIGSTSNASPCDVTRHCGAPAISASPHAAPTPAVIALGRPGRIARPGSIRRSPGAIRISAPPSRPHTSRPTSSTGPSIAGSVRGGIAPSRSTRSTSPARATSSQRPVRDIEIRRTLPDGAARESVVTGYTHRSR